MQKPRKSCTRKYRSLPTNWKPKKISSVLGNTSTSWNGTKSILSAWHLRLSPKCCPWSRKAHRRPSYKCAQKEMRNTRLLFWPLRWCFLCLATDTPGTKRDATPRKEEDDWGLHPPRIWRLLLRQKECLGCICLHSLPCLQRSVQRMPWRVCTNRKQLREDWLMPSDQPTSKMVPWVFIEGSMPSSCEKWLVVAYFLWRTKKWENYAWSGILVDECKTKLLNVNNKWMMVVLKTKQSLSYGCKLLYILQILFVSKLHLVRWYIILYDKDCLI